MAYKINPIPVEEAGYKNLAVSTRGNVTKEASKSNMSSYFEPTYDATPVPTTTLSQTAPASTKINNYNAVQTYKAQNNNVSNAGGGNVSGGNVSGGNVATQTVVQSNPYESYFNKMMEIYQQQLAAEQARQEQLRQERIAAANKVKDARIKATNETYDSSMGNLNSAKESSLRQAYIKHMQDQRALPQQMQAFGMSGGATETNLANMKNAYGNNRTNIMNEVMEQQRLIEQDRANAIAGAEADAANAYIDAVSDASNYEASAVRDYNNGLLSLYESALSNMPTYSNTQSTTTSNITKNPWYDVAVGYLSDGNSTNEVIATLRQQGVSDEIIDAILYNWESTI